MGIIFKSVGDNLMGGPTQELDHGRDGTKDKRMFLNGFVATGSL